MKNIASVCRSAGLCRALLYALLLTALTAAPGAAQSGGPDVRAVSLTMKLGVFMPRGQGDLFALVTNHLAAGRSDFRSVAATAEGGLRLTDRLELRAGLGASQATHASRFQRATQSDGSAIEQTSRLRVAPAAYLAPRIHLFPRHQTTGDGIHSWNAYVAMGAGGIQYRFQQWGEFFDDEEEVPFAAQFTSDGFAFLSFLSAGVDVPVLARTGLTIDARYQLANGRLIGDFRDVGGIDLSGFAISAGLTRRIR